MSEHSDASTTESSGRPAAARGAGEGVEDVLGEVGRQARHLVGEAQDQLRAQTEAAQHKAAESLSALAGELSLMAQRSKQTGLATDLVRQAGEQIEDASHWLERRSPGDLVEEARSFARRRPGTFLLGAALLGAAAGRLTRGVSGRPERGQQVGTEPGVRTATDAAQATGGPEETEGYTPASRGPEETDPGSGYAVGRHAPVPDSETDGLAPGAGGGHEPAPAAVTEPRSRPTVGEYVREVERRTGAPLTAGPPPANPGEADRR